MSKIMLSSVISSTLIALLLFINNAQAQDATTVLVNIDGITRTVTIVISNTEVLSVTVAPISDTFQTTSTAWLNSLHDVYGSVQPETHIDITETHKALNVLLADTDEAPYPAYWAPFVRQYRFAIHNCRHWLQIHANIIDNQEGAGLLAGVYFTMYSACNEQYQDAYVEMERIAHPLPPVQNDRNK
jgi:hypothetical protein